MARVFCVTTTVLVLCLHTFMGLCDAMNSTGAQGESLQTKTFRSPGFFLSPGDVIDKYLPVAMPRGHIAVRSLDVTVVDSSGSQIPLSETYLQRWRLIRYHIDPTSTNVSRESTPVANDGVCRPVLAQWFGPGSRHTNSTVPPPYGIVLGDPADVPDGLDEVWFLNVHAVDTRGVVDARGCIECHCDVYKATTDGYGRDLPAGYEGGQFCCNDEAHCPLRLGFEGAPRRELFLEFTIAFVDYSDTVVPVKVFLLDVTDRRTAWDQPAQCMVEYTVPKCNKVGGGGSECVHKQEAVAFLPEGGYVIYSSAHLHNGGLGASISLQNGHKICESRPIYGQGGSEAGNETGYIVGMTSCYPDPKAIYIRPREKLHLKALYSSEVLHTGAVGILLLLIADGPAPPPSIGESFTVLEAVSASLIGMVIVAAVIFGVLRLHRWRHARNAGLTYNPIDVSAAQSWQM